MEPPHLAAFMFICEQGKGLRTLEKPLVGIQVCCASCPSIAPLCTPVLQVQNTSLQHRRLRDEGTGQQVGLA